MVVWRGRRFPVTHIERRWRTPEGPAFSVETEQGVSFELLYNEADDLWTIQPHPGFDLETFESAQQAEDELEDSNHNHDEDKEVLKQP